jgi:sulfonate transport system substrate-binding protein
MIKKSKVRLRMVLMSFLAATISVGRASAEDPVKSAALPPNVPGNERIAHIGLVDVTAVAARKGWLQEEFAKHNAKADLVNVSSFGGSGIEASLLDRGDLHITQRMAYPALQHRANGLDAVVVWQGVDPHPRRAVTMVLADSDIKTVADLKGKKYGSSLIGCPYYASREAFLKQKVDVDTEFSQGDIRFVNITGVAATTAFLAGRFDAYGTHPATATTAPLYVQKQVREISTAEPGGIYVTAGGRQMYFAMRKWAEENPDLVQAFLVAWDRTVRWLYSDNGAHLQEAATIAARELRIPKSVALYNLKDESTISYTWGQTSYQEAVDSIKKFQNWAIGVKDPFYTKHRLTDKEIEKFVDKRFFAGGAYFVDTAQKKAHAASEASPQSTLAKK